MRNWTKTIPGASFKGFPFHVEDEGIGEARRALSPLIVQGACVRVDASAEADYANDAMLLTVALYGRDGSQVFAAKFDLLWKNAVGGA